MLVVSDQVIVESFRRFCWLMLSGIDCHSLVSSVKDPIIAEHIAASMPYIIMMKSNEPSTQSGGTPEDTGMKGDSLLLTRTACCLLVRKLSIHF